MSHLHSSPAPHDAHPRKEQTRAPVPATCTGDSDRALGPGLLQWFREMNLCKGELSLPRLFLCHTVCQVSKNKQDSINKIVHHSLQSFLPDVQISSSLTSCLLFRIPASSWHSHLAEVLSHQQTSLACLLALQDGSTASDLCPVGRTS